MESPRDAIGREERATDTVTAALVERFGATLGIAPPASGRIAPRLIHFCLAQPAAPAALLGRDGHPATGDVLPRLPLPRRMWAGSDIRFHGDLCIGDTVERRSRVADIVRKQGRTGELYFVTVDHDYRRDGATVIEDRQTLVYRADDASPPPPGPAAPHGTTSIALVPDDVLLFRYSALTFNGHRIHYDRRYAVEVEGYRGLVVHGPMQATLLYHLAAEVSGRPPDLFTFRSISTLFDGEAMALHAGEMTDNALPLWTAREGGPVAMQAEARWA